jgi:hypothetical protein
MTAKPDARREAAAVGQNLRALARMLNARRARLHVAVAVCVVAASVLPVVLAWPAALAAIAAQLAAMWLKSQAADTHLKSREWFRLFLLADGLAQPMLSFDRVEILASSDLGNTAAGQTVKGSYYTTKAAPGPDRLAINIAESCFFSKHVLQIQQQTATYSAAVFSTLFGLLTVGLLTIWPGPDRAIVVIAASALALVVLDDVESLFAIRRATRMFEVAERHIETAVGSSSVQAYLTALADYAVASSLGPPIDSNVYEVEKARLEPAWKERCQLYESRARR